MNHFKISNPKRWYKLDADCFLSEKSINIKTRIFILQRDNYTCRYCGTKKAPFEVDHVMPKSRGGSNNTKNLLCSCRKCNRQKKDRTPLEMGWEILKNEMV